MANKICMMPFTYPSSLSLATPSLIFYTQAFSRQICSNCSLCLKFSKYCSFALMIPAHSLGIIQMYILFWAVSLKIPLPRFTTSCVGIFHPMPPSKFSFPFLLYTALTLSHSPYQLQLPLYSLFSRKHPKFLGDRSYILFNFDGLQIYTEKGKHSYF